VDTGAARAPRHAVRARRALLPLDTLEAVGRLFGVYAITEGVLVVLTGIRGTPYRGVLIAEGASGIVAGLLALAWPSITALVLMYVVAIWAILSGVAEMIAAVSLRRVIGCDVGSVSRRDPLRRPRGGDGGPARRGAALAGLAPRALCARGGPARPNVTSHDQI
jgi:hypothetical protein